MVDGRQTSRPRLRKSNGPGNQLPGPSILHELQSYFTVIVIFIPNALWGKQKPLYTPLGAFANETS